jgi:hypothetical protein
MTRALDLRAEFFASIFDTLQHRRLNAIMSRMQARKSLAHGISESGLHHRLGGTAQSLYDIRVDKLNIQFAVERLPLAAEISTRGSCGSRPASSTRSTSTRARR